MPDAFISTTTSWASGVGSGNCIISSLAFAREHNAAHRYLRFLACGLILNAKILIGKVRTGSDLA